MKGPVVIGGVGGSGTRVIARIFYECGFYMGSHLNEAYDNLWFTLIFRRTKWLERAKEKEIMKAIQLFDAAMNGKLKPTLTQRIFILNAVAEFIFRHYIKAEDWRSLPVAISHSLIQSKKISLKNYSCWGWKEPNAHLFISQLSDFYPQMKYIHVIRHGLDMAFSKNQIQLRNFGKRFGVTAPQGKAQLPVASLEYWIRANREAIQTGTSLLGKNFLLLNFEHFCTHPKEEIKKLLDFAEVNPDEQTLNTLNSFPQLPDSAGRYKNQDISVFTKEQLDAVKALGYDINF